MRMERGQNTSWQSCTAAAPLLLLDGRTMLVLASDSTDEIYEISDEIKMRYSIRCDEISDEIGWDLDGIG